MDSERLAALVQAVKDQHPEVAELVYLLFKHTNTNTTRIKRLERGLCHSTKRRGARTFYCQLLFGHEGDCSSGGWFWRGSSHGQNQNTSSEEDR